MGIAGGLFFVWLLLYRLIVFGVAFFCGGGGGHGNGGRQGRGEECILPSMTSFKYLTDSEKQIFLKNSQGKPAVLKEIHQLFS